MKNTLSTVLCVMLTVALVAAALCIGAVRGWSGERDSALHALTASGDLADTLSARAMDAANLAVVASRHVAENDENTAALRSAYRTLTDASAEADALFRADAAISQAAANLAQILPELDSVKASARDQVYISTLTRTLSQPTGAAEAYQNVVSDYNTRLTRSLSGKLAMLLGITPLGAD